jgi:uncharacterized protein DUF4430
VLHRPFVVVGVAVLALAVVAPALAVRVHVRVEGARTTIFGPTEPRLTAVNGPIAPPAGPVVTVDAATPFGALEAASRAGEFYYRVEAFSFGPYVAQIGRRPGTSTTGWVYKVNGASPPVSATAYQLKAGDRVLWYHATFGAAGGPRTLQLVGTFSTGCPAGAGDCVSRLACVRAVVYDDNGRRSPAATARFLVDGRPRAGRNGRLCPRSHWHSVRATLAGAVRSNVLVNPAGRRGSGSAGAALAGRS